MERGTCCCHVPPSTGAHAQVCLAVRCAALSQCSLAVSISTGVPHKHTGECFHGPIMRVLPGQARPGSSSPSKAAARARKIKAKQTTGHHEFPRHEQGHCLFSLFLPSAPTTEPPYVPKKAYPRLMCMYSQVGSVPAMHAPVAAHTHRV